MPYIGTVKSIRPKHSSSERAVLHHQFTLCKPSFSYTNRELACVHSLYLLSSYFQATFRQNHVLFHKGAFAPCPQLAGHCGASSWQPCPFSGSQAKSRSRRCSLEELRPECAEQGSVVLKSTFGFDQAPARGLGPLR
jgi:hypothetical protein